MSSKVAEGWRTIYWLDMDVRAALKQQYHGGLAMLRECVEMCPDDLWAAANPPVTPTKGTRVLYPSIAERQFWRIAFHCAYFTHLYLGQGVGVFQPPPETLAVRSREEFRPIWEADSDPYDFPSGTQPCGKDELLAYLSYLDGLVDATVDGLDLDSDDCGFPWYKGKTKLSHEMMNLRHLQGHVGQLSELLMMRGIDIKWVG